MGDNWFVCPDRAERYWDSTYQWDLSDLGCTKVDADAVGIGMVASFMISATILVLAITVAYISSSIPEALVGELDRHLMLRLQDWLPSRLRTNDQRQQLRIDALANFLLSLADQQLVTALGLLIAAYAHWRDITIYAMTVTGTLTLLASAVFASALSMTSSPGSPSAQYSKTRSGMYGLPKNFRFAVTIVNFVGMVFLFVVSWGDNWYPSNEDSDLYFLPGVEHFRLSDDTTFIFVINMFILSAFILGTVDTGFCLYTQYLGWTSWVVSILLRHWNLPEDKIPTARQYVEAHAKILPDANVFPLRPLLFRQRWAKLDSRWQNKNLEEIFSFHVYQQSFASWQLVNIMFAFLYGTVNIFITRDGPGQRAGISGEPNTWSFGQIVPMVLLVLPLLAAMKGYNDYTTQEDPHTPTETMEMMESLEAARHLANGNSQSAYPPNKTSITMRQSSKDDWEDHGFNPLNCQAIRLKIWVHATGDILFNIVFAVTTPFSWMYDDWVLIVFCRISFMYTVITGIRGLYGCLVGPVCLRQCSAGKLQFRISRWVGMVAPMICVVNFLLSCLFFALFTSSKAVKEWFWTSVGPFVTVLMWVIIAAMPAGSNNGYSPVP